MNGWIRRLILGVFLLSTATHASGKYVWDIDPRIDWSAYTGFSTGLSIQAYSAAGDHSLVAMNSQVTDVYENSERVVRVWYWNSEFKLWETPQDMPVYLVKDSQAPESEEFGMSISIDGARIAVGAPDWDNNRGAVYVFERSENGDWRATTRIEEQSRGFGRVELQGDLMVVGSLEPGNQPVYVYRFAHDRWTKEAELHGDTAYMGFGRSLDIDGNRIAVGSHYENAAYIYRYNRGAWELEQKLISLVSEGYFGTSLDLEGDRLVIGAPGGESSGASNRKGAVYVYQRNANGWNEVTTVVPANDYQVSDLFGYSAQISPDGFIAVGAPGVGCANEERCSVDGAVYLFQEVGGAKWRQVVHVATAGAGDNVQLRGRHLWTSGGTMLSDYVFDIKDPVEKGKGSTGQPPGSSAGGGSGGGGSVSFVFLLVSLLFAGYRGERAL